MLKNKVNNKQMPLFAQNRVIWFDMRGACRRRVLELDRLMAYIRINGFIIADRIEDADILVVYRCCINNSRELVSLRYLEESAPMFSDIVCLGGLASIYSAQYLEQYKGKCALHYISLRDVLSIDYLFTHNTPLSAVPLANYSWSEPEAYSIQVGLGCESNCSYCGDRKIVGHLQSFSLDSITRQFENGLRQGYRSFDLVGDDVGAWGKDIGSDIMALLDMVTSFPDDYSVSMQEVNIKYLIEQMGRYEIILNRKKIKFLVVAFQHVNNRLLKLMNRGYTGEDVGKLIQVLTKHGIKKRFHAILGFPSETIDELIENVDFLCNNDFFSGSYFIYQSRKYAPSSQFPGHFSDSEIKTSVDIACTRLISGGYSVIDESRVTNENNDADRLLVKKEK
jgi:tRNA A37 methylthiotransferase MiaB